VAGYDDIKKAIKEGIQEAVAAISGGGPGSAPGGGGAGGNPDDGSRVGAIQARIAALEEENNLRWDAIQTADTEYMKKQAEKEIAENLREIDKERVKLLERRLRNNEKLSEAEAEFLEQQHAIAAKEKDRLKTRDQMVSQGVDMLQNMNSMILGQSTMGKLIGGGIKGMQNFVKGAKGLDKALKAGAISAQMLTAALGIGIIIAVIMVIVKLVEWIFKLAVETRDAAVGFQRMTGASYAMGEQMAIARKELQATGVSMEEMREQYTALYRETTIFTEASSAQQKQMAKTGAVLAELGVSSKDYAKGVQGAVKGLGVSLSDADNVMLEMRAHAMDIGVDVGTLANQFANAAGSMAQFGKEGVKAFKDLSMISKITGMDLNKVLELTGKFDTFEDAATMTGKLNAALGGNFVNAMDMMMETDPAKRFKSIRKAIMQTGLSFDEMGYHQKKMFTEMLGFKDESELAQMMSGDMEGLAGNIGKTSKEYAAARKDAQRWQSTMDILKNTLASLAPTFSEFGKVIKEVMDEFINNEDSVAKIRDSLERIVNGLLLPLVKKKNFPEMMKNFVDSLGKVAAGFEEISKAAKTIAMWSKIIGASFQVLLGIFEFLMAANPLYWTVVKPLEMLWDFLKPLIKVYTTMGETATATDYLKAAWEGLTTSLWGVVRPIVNVFEGLVSIRNAVLEKRSPSLLDILVMMPGLFDNIGGAAGVLLNPLKSLGGVFDIMHEKVVGWQKAFLDTWDSLKTEVPNKIRELANSMGEAFGFEAMGDKIQNGITSWKKGIDAGITELKSWLGISSPSSEMQKAVGDPMVGGILASFTSLGPALAQMAINAIDELPEWAQGGLRATSQMLTTGASALAGVTSARGTAGAPSPTAQKPYQLTINMQLDRRTLSSEVVDIVGGEAFLASR